MAKVCTRCHAELEGPITVCPYDGFELEELPPDPLIGTVFAEKYEILSVLGKGGMSTVYKARHLYMQRIVAIKMLHNHLISDATAIERFKQEGQAASSLKHRNIITVYDFGITPDDRAFLIMDFLEGPTLADLLEQNNYIDVGRAIKIFRQLCDGLEHAHKKGIVHRDLKPSNVCLIEEEEQTDVVKIVDFGIAKLLPAEGTKRQQMTQTGQIFGSPLFMSPEQCQGKMLDGRSDLYSLGCLMYEALTGTPPLMGDTSFDTMNMHVSVKPKEMSAVAPNLNIPPELDSIVAKALEKQPSKRYQTAKDLRNDLPKEITEAATTTAVQRLMQWHHKRRRLFFALQSAATLVALAMTWYLFLSPGPETDPGPPWRHLWWQFEISTAENFHSLHMSDIAEQWFEGAESWSMQFDDNCNRLVLTLRAKRRFFHAIGAAKKEMETQNKLSQAQLRQVLEQFKDELSDLDSMGKRYNKVNNDFKDDIDRTRARTEMYEKIVARGSRTTDTAAALYGHGLHKEAVTLLKKALAVDSQILSDRHERIADLETLVADYYHDNPLLCNENPKLADLAIRELYQHALKVYIEKNTEQSPEVIKSLLKLSRHDRDYNRFEDGRKEVNRAIDLATRSGDQALVKQAKDDLSILEHMVDNAKQAEPAKKP